jgi:hypothetical protein
MVGGASIVLLARDVQCPSSIYIHHEICNEQFIFEALEEPDQRADTFRSTQASNLYILNKHTFKRTEADLADPTSLTMDDGQGAGGGECSALDSARILFQPRAADDGSIGPHETNHEVTSNFDEFEW